MFIFLKKIENSESLSSNLCTDSTEIVVAPKFFAHCRLSEKTTWKANEAIKNEWMFFRQRKVGFSQTEFLASLCVQISQSNKRA